MLLFAMNVLDPLIRIQNASDLVKQTYAELEQTYPLALTDKCTVRAPTIQAMTDRQQLIAIIEQTHGYLSSLLPKLLMDINIVDKGDLAVMLRVPFQSLFYAIYPFQMILREMIVDF